MTSSESSASNKKLIIDMHVQHLLEQAADPVTQSGLALITDGVGKGHGSAQ